MWSYCKLPLDLIVYKWNDNVITYFIILENINGNPLI